MDKDSHIRIHSPIPATTDIPLISGSAPVHPFSLSKGNVIAPPRFILGLSGFCSNASFIYDFSWAGGQKYIYSPDGAPPGKRNDFI